MKVIDNHSYYQNNAHPPCLSPVLGPPTCVARMCVVWVNLDKVSTLICNFFSDCWHAYCYACTRSFIQQIVTKSEIMC